MMGERGSFVFYAIDNASSIYNVYLSFYYLLGKKTGFLTLIYYVNYFLFTKKVGSFMTF